MLECCNCLFVVAFQELNDERVKSAATIKSLQEKAEEKLKNELEQKVFCLFHFCVKHFMHCSAFDIYMCNC